jgi:serine phosphatase RsbU (regulator of sigma subunit)
MSNDGSVTVANAGHIAPYLGGHELPVTNGLPLGLTASASYAKSAFQLSPDDRLTLLTDGVLEARRVTGELFGFARTASISAQPADKIAHAAEQFGQRDDITVLSLTRQKPEGAGEPVACSAATA